MATGTSLTRVVTGKVRLSYVHLFEPWSGNNDDKDPKYSCVILIPKSDKKTLRDINKAIEAAKESGKTKTWDGRIPKDLHITLRDGDDEDTLEANPEYEGCMFMNVGSKTRPGIVDRDVKPILDSTEVYSGCYARVEINAFPYNVKGNKGVAFGLNNVQKWADGESLGGRTRAEDAFDSLDDDEDDEDLI